MMAQEDDKDPAKEGEEKGWGSSNPHSPMALCTDLPERTLSLQAIDIVSEMYRVVRRAQFTYRGTGTCQLYVKRSCI